jgi:hypothetical protein
MLNEQQFGKIKPQKPKAPRSSSGRGSGGYKFLPVPTSQEERDLMEAKARELNFKISKNLQEGRNGQH